MEQNLGINQQICEILGVGVGVEGILRQSADVEDVERRVLDYEQGRLFWSICLSTFLFRTKWYGVQGLPCCQGTCMTELLFLWGLPFDHYWSLICCMPCREKPNLISRRCSCNWWLHQGMLFTSLYVDRLEVISGMICTFASYLLPRAFTFDVSYCLWDGHFSLRNLHFLVDWKLIKFTWSMQHVLRELPSSPVPTSCCTALLEAQSKDLLHTQHSSVFLQQIKCWLMLVILRKFNFTKRNLNAQISLMVSKFSWTCELFCSIGLVMQVGLPIPLVLTQ